METKINLLTWMSTGFDPDILGDFKTRVMTKKKCAVDKIYYLYTSAESARKKDIQRVLETVKSRFPEVVPVPVPIEDPSKHKGIYDCLKNCLESKLPEMERLCINLTSGTPAMHAVWLLLYAGGFFRKGTELYSVQRYKTKDGKDISRLDDVNFEINTYLSAVKNFAATHPEKPMYREPNSPKRKKAFGDILRYINIPEAPLLIMGERGCGKTCFVETWITSIKGKNVVTIPCGTLDADRFEAMLFGYNKGAYTGATEGKVGLIEQARNNILFLDEIQDLAPDTQRKLLRVLNERKYTKFQDTKENEISFQLICATNASIEDLKAKLHPDFYDRVCMFRVQIPPLRECREDLLDDWTEVWQTLQKVDRSVSSLEGEDLESLKRYLEKSDLSGNFRSLKRIAYQRLAWGDEKSMQEIIDETDADNSLVVAGSVQEFNVEDFPEFQGLTWDDAQRRFRQKLAKWAVKKYKKMDVAAEKMQCSEKTLRTYSK